MADNTFHTVFGAPNAMDDDLLASCYVEPSGLTNDQTIIVGKWGVGKTATLLHRNKDLTSFLHGSGATKIPLWYLEETGISTEELSRLIDLSGGSESRLCRSLERIWYAEIIRATSIVLSKIRRENGNSSEPHWKQVQLIGEFGPFLKPVWGAIKGLTKYLFSEDTGTVLDGVAEGHGKLFERSLYDSIQRCLGEIKHLPYYPVVGVEPLDSPESQIEKQPSVADQMVKSLINCYRQHFVPSASQRIKVMLSLPNHRFKPTNLINPQHTRHLVGTFRWKANSLREFMNKRIEYEYKRVGRRWTERPNYDAWRTLFDDTVRNEYCAGEGQLREDTFSYVLRHTHYRPRDLQRFARQIVRHQADNSDSGLDDILAGKSGPIKGRILRAAVRNESLAAAEERLIEARRQYPELGVVMSALNGLQAPISQEDLRKRLKSQGELGEAHSAFSECLEKLWNTGIVGLEILSSKTNAKQFVEQTFGSNCVATHTLDGKSIHRYFLFEHTNQNRKLSELLALFQGTDRNGFDNGDVMLVFHPMFFEKLVLRPTHEYPIGI